MTIRVLIADDQMMVREGFSVQPQGLDAFARSPQHLPEAFRRDGGAAGRGGRGVESCRLSEVIGGASQVATSE